MNISLSVVISRSVVSICDPMDYSLSSSSFLGISQGNEIFSFHSPGELPDSGVEFMSPALTGRFFTTEPPGKPISLCIT